MSRPALVLFASRRLQPVAAALLALAALQFTHAVVARPPPAGVHAARGQIAWARS